MATRKITDLSRAKTPVANDLVIVETSSGTKAMTYEDFTNPAIKKRGRSPLFLFLLQLLLDFCSFTNALADIIELCSSDFTAADSLHRDNGRGMNGEHLFASHIVGDAADGNRLIDATVLLRNNRPFESLISFAVAFLHADGHSYSVADVHRGQFRFHILLAECFDKIHF